MKSKIIIATTAILLGVVLYAGIYQAHQTEIPEEVRIQFQKWKRSQNKLYGSPSEDNYRLSVFYKALKMINAHNAGGHSYTLGINQFADLTKEEFLAKYTGGLVPPDETAEVQSNQSTVGLPPSIDWTTRGAVTPVKYQGQCGGCWAFSTTGAMEGLKAIAGQGLTSLSEQQLMDCTLKMGNFGCRGGYPRNSFKYVAQNGIEAESSYPYQSRVGPCRANPSKYVFRVRSFLAVGRLDNNGLQVAVANQPVSVLIDASSIMYYKGGIVGAGCGQRINHAVLAVGYGNTNGTPYWKVKNSWGTSWGEAGYIRIQRVGGVAPAPCGINIYASRPVL